MKKIRHKLVLMLVVIMIVSSALANMMAWPLVSEFFADMETWVGELLCKSFENALTLLIFTLFVLIGVREITTPLMKLSAATQRIAEGDFDVVFEPTKRKDEIGELERNFAVMAGELRSTEYMQKDFVTNVSHEFKTPLAVISGYAKLLADATLPAEERGKYSSFIVEEAAHLNHMTRNILLLSKLENTRIKPPMTVFALDEQLRQTALCYVHPCKEKNISLQVDVPEIRIRGNEELLMHVFANLLDNAVKFTPHDGRIRLYADKADGNVVVSVADNGIGMDAETRKHIFDQFYQGDTSRQGMGNGLGLPLVKRIVKLHRGSVDVASSPGKGSTFSVKLPSC